MEQKNRAIAVFDSGVGGISVLRELVACMPNERFLYYGDSRNAPYGPRTTEQCRELTLQSIQLLLQEELKAVVIACNTATSVAIELLRKMYPQMIFVGIEPALQLAVDRHPGGKIVVMATDTTLREQRFQTQLAKCPKENEIVPLPCPGLVELIEAGKLETSETEAYLRQRLAPYLEHLSAVVLGCTHYPFVQKMISRIVGPGVELLHGGPATALQTKHCLEAAGLLRDAQPGEVLLRNSLGTEEILALQDRLLHLKEI